MASDRAVSLRDRRKPGHGWFDNEIYDVFGDELRQDGISVYMTLARLCYGVSVTMSLREMSGHARMSKDTFGRNLKRVIALGLVIERKGMSPQSASTYELVDVKELAAQYLRDAVRKSEAKGQSVSPRDTRSTVTLVQLISGRAANDVQDVVLEDAAKCLTVRQEASEVVSVPVPGDKKICVADSATLLSQNDPHFATEVSQAMRHPHRQDTRHKTQDNTPLPPSQAMGECGATESLGVRDAVQRVMDACHWSDRKLRRALQKAMSDYRRKPGALEFEQIADKMSCAWAEFLRVAHLMRYRVGEENFILRGLWVSDSAWPYDERRLADYHRAGVGGH